uniref:WD40 repeat domain-containing serine/threonine protein kinase n=1 Tax=uncultured Flavonifractor sp. TaxID=1193534 RepID=UPI002631864F|nr:WD40 repeat domain-containing serine/threonine protein kinase [uncultured Flavonifractor sp.]
MDEKNPEQLGSTPHIVASVYQIQKEIGSGGGGIVYLGEHLRLGKQVVLKADRRTLSARPETLRREVDALKNLSHTYIPQVYDFVEEQGAVYTVMDYIPGESLDKPLKRGERFKQAQVIRWARQLLEALQYLHSRPPHGILHGDIKPANVMLTPSGDICLIDFNIALALGEEGAVRVGFSRGYASPEHYGQDYSSSATKTVSSVDTAIETQLPTHVETVLPVSSGGSSGQSYGRGAVLLDARSDIYSLGATLYHLFTGTRPAKDAKDVVPMSGDGLSPQIIQIVKKAMAPDPAQRYQSAAEMLDAFQHLHERDPRTRRYRRRMAITGVALAVLFGAGGFCTFTGLKQLEQQQAAYALAEYSANALAEGDVSAALSYALEALPRDKSIFNAPYTAQAQKALTDALGVYDLSDGFHPHGAILLPSEPLKVVMSPDGTRIAVFYAYEAAVYDIASGAALLQLPMEESALSDICFADENTLVFAGRDGLQVYDLAEGTVQWTGEPAAQVTISADGSRVSALYKDNDTAVVYRVADGQEIARVDFEGRQQRVAVNNTLADPNDDLFALNKNGTMLAVSFSDGSILIYDLEDRNQDLILFDTSQYTHFEGGFYGDYFAFSAYTPGDGIFVVIDTANTVQTGAFAGTQPFLTRADESGIYLANEDVVVKLHPVTGEQTEAAYTEGKTITDFVRGSTYTLVTTEDQTWWIFDQAANCIGSEQVDNEPNFIQISDCFAVLGSLNTPSLRTMELEDHRDAQILTYDPSFAHDEARLSADGKTVMLFDINHFRLYGIDGQVLAEGDFPSPEQIYDQQYRRDDAGSRLEVTYYDGTIRTYSAKDGTLLSETMGEKPDESLHEEFITNHWKITAPLHEAPVAYDRESGRMIRELEQDAYLTYVTQVGDYVITEYISVQGERYGLILDQNCETIAYLPNLCDIVGNQLVFDDLSGNLRQSRLYSIQELFALADQKKEEMS